MRRHPTGRWLMSIASAAVVIVGSTGSRIEAGSPPPGASAIDAPEISRSRGAPGSVVVLWPRIIPADDGPEARRLARGIQEKLVLLAREAFPGRDLDVRPAPERVCPMGGCDGTAVGALLLKRDDGCAVVALISQPGPVPMSLVPWAGDVRLRASRIPFRQHPENWVTVTDFTRCDGLPAGLETNDEPVRLAMRDLAP